MINWIKAKWQDNIFHKMWIFITIWNFIFIALWMTTSAIAATLYTWYYFPNVNFINWSENLLANWVVKVSLGISFVIFIGCLFY